MRQILIVLCVVASVVSCTLPGEATVSATSATQPASQQAKKATYFLVPIKGIVGTDFTAGRMRSYLKQAEKLAPTVIVLELDTPGGLVADAEEIIDLIISNKDLRFVAFVRKALSAGAAVTLACREIYVTESATIGAATSYLPDRTGRPMMLPKDVAEKFQSAWRAVCRKAAQYGGHPALLGEAMVDPDFALTMRKEKRVPGRLEDFLDRDRVVLERNGKGNLLKARGRILTLTAREAVACGLAKGIVPNHAMLGQKLGVTGWHTRKQEAGAESGTFYDLLFQNAQALKLTDPSLTGLQRDVGERKWDAWWRREGRKFKGRRVQWSLRLVRATTVGPRRIALLRTWLSSAQARLRKDRDDRGAKQDIAWMSAELRRSRFVEVRARSASNARVWITAWVPLSFRDYIARIPKGGNITLSGRIAKVEFVARSYAQPRPEPDFHVSITLEGCTAGAHPEDPGRPKGPRLGPSPKPKTAVEKADTQLRLARNYIASGMRAKARVILESILTAYPDSKAAREARKELKALK